MDEKRETVTEQMVRAGAQAMCFDDGPDECGCSSAAECKAAPESGLYYSLSRICLAGALSQEEERARELRKCRFFGFLSHVVDPENGDHFPCTIYVPGAREFMALLDRALSNAIRREARAEALEESEPREVFYVQFAEDGTSIRKWSRTPFEGARKCRALMAPLPKGSGCEE